MERWNEVLEECRKKISSNMGVEDKLQSVCELLRNSVDHYDWVGFYIAVRDQKALALGPYSGDPTEHTSIGYGEGICGQAAETEKTFLIQDVRGEENYLACSLEVKSEIVIPVFGVPGFVGEIDIDSHTISPFTEKDTDMLEQLSVFVSPLVEELSTRLSGNPR